MEGDDEKGARADDERITKADKFSNCEKGATYWITEWWFLPIDLANISDEEETSSFMRGRPKEHQKKECGGIYVHPPQQVDRN